MITEDILRMSDEQLAEIPGLVSDIERYAINDGYGIRTTVFLKGCPLRCRWCSNPETQKYYPEMVFFQDKCIACQACLENCPYGALDEKLVADRQICNKCHERPEAFSCIKQCYPKCRKISGERKTIQEMVAAIKRDVPFYEHSGGGATISGGEPLAQPEYTFALLKMFQANWIHTAIETCGVGDAEDYEAIAPYLDLVFMDLKSINTEKHKEWTGASNEKILRNIRLMDELAGVHHFQFIVRTPVIPGFNDSIEDMKEIAGFLAENCRHYSGVELLPYHKLGRGKYTSLGREYMLNNLEVPSETHMASLNRVIADYGIPLYQF